MSTNFTPSAGRIRVIAGENTIKKFPLPTTARKINSGDALWTNGTGGVESATMPAGITVGSASTYTTVELNNAAFAPLFAGFAAESRVPQQLSAALTGYLAGGAVSTTGVNDASRPFLSVITEGVAEAPYFDGTYSTVQGQLEIGTLVNLGGFANEASTGFYANDGTLQKDTKSYLYANSVKTTSTAANAIGVICERAKVGDTTVKFTFKSAVLNPADVL